MWVEKYRPTKFADMVLDADHKSALEGFLEDEAIPHLLLVGAVGSGKTTIGRILAKALDCSVLEMNASDERGIDVVRDKVKRFLMTAGLRRWRVVFLDEADQLTPDAQACLRVVIEKFSGHGRFLMTANFEDKIIEAVRSRCQILRFKTLDRKRVYRLSSKILADEDVKFEPEDVLRVIEDHYPDVRSVVNALQLGSRKGEFTYAGMFDVVNEIRQLLLQKNVNGIRKLVLTHRPDFTLVYRGLFDSIPKFVKDAGARKGVAINIADYMWRDAIVADREINFAACCLEISEVLG
jgi:replication factor C small subunit